MVLVGINKVPTDGRSYVETRCNTEVTGWKHEKHSGCAQISFGLKFSYMSHLNKPVSLALTVGKLQSCLFFLLARSGSCFRFDIGHLLWFQSTWKNHRINVFSAVGLGCLSCQAEQSDVELGKQNDTDVPTASNRARLSVWIQSGSRSNDTKGAAADVLKDDKFINLTLKWQPPELNWKNRLVCQIWRDSSDCQTAEKCSVFMRRTCLKRQKLKKHLADWTVRVQNAL